MSDTNEILELKFEGGGVNPSLVKPHEIADLITNFEKCLLAAIKQNNPEIDTETLLFSFDEVKNESLGLKFKPSIAKEIVISGYFLITTSVKTGDYNGLNATSIKSLKSFTTFSKKYQCEGKFNYNNETLSSFNPSTEITVNKNKIIKEETTIYGKLIDVGGEKPNIHLKINDDYVLIFDTSEANAKLLAARLYEKVKLIGEAKWDAENYQIVDFKLSSISDYVSGNTLKAIKELKDISSGFWDKFSNNDEINDQLLRD